MSLGRETFTCSFWLIHKENSYFLHQTAKNNIFHDHWCPGKSLVSVSYTFPQNTWCFQDWCIASSMQELKKTIVSIHYQASTIITADTTVASNQCYTQFRKTATVLTTQLSHSNSLPRSYPAAVNRNSGDLASASPQPAVVLYITIHPSLSLWIRGHANIIVRDPKSSSFGGLACREVGKRKQM